jgi:hypothetical protein
VPDLGAEYAYISALGAEVLVEPTQVSAAFGRRRLAFFRSPGGFVFEVMQALERKILLLLETRKFAIAARASHSEIDGGDFLMIDRVPTDAEGDAIRGKLGIRKKGQAGQKRSLGFAAPIINPFRH